MSTLIPPAAPPGSTIAVVAPAGPAESRADVQRGIAWWQAQGYRVTLGAGAFERIDWHAGAPRGAGP